MQSSNPVLDKFLADPSSVDASDSEVMDTLVGPNSGAAKAVSITSPNPDLATSEDHMAFIDPNSDVNKNLNAIQNTPSPEETLFGWISNYARYNQDAYGKGEAGVYRGVIGFKPVDSTGTYEDAHQAGTSEQIRNLQADQESLAKKLPWWDLHQATGFVAELIPQLVEMGKGYAIGSLAGTGIGAMVGVAGAGESGGISVLGGLTVGQELGANAGMFLVNARLATGNLYMDLREAGHSHDVSKNIALVGGALQGYLQTVGISRLDSVGRKAVADQLASPVGKKLFRGLLTRYAKSVGVQASVGALNTLTENLSVKLANEIEKNPEADLSVQQIIVNTLGGAEQGAVQGAALTPVAHVAGVATGKALKAVIKPDTFSKAVKFVNENFDRKPTLEDITRIKEEPVQQILDALKQPIGTMEETAQGPELKTTVSKGPSAFDTLKSIPKTEKEETPEKESVNPSEEVKPLPKTAEGLINAYKKGVMKGKRLTKIQIKEIQTALMQIVNREVPPEERRAFMALIKNTQTERQVNTTLTKIEARVQALMEKRNRKAQLKLLGRLIKQTGLKKGKRAVGKYTADIQDILDMYRDGVTLKGHLQQVAEKMALKQQKDIPFTDNDYLEAAIAERTVNIKEQPSENIALLNAEIKEVIENGKAAHLEYRAAEQERTQRIKTAVIQSIQGKRPVSGIPESDRASTIHPRVKKIFQVLRTLGHNADMFVKQLAIIGQDDLLVSKGKTPVVVTELTHTRAQSELDRLQDKWRGKLKHTLQTAISKENKKKLIKKLFGLNKKKDLGDPIWADGTRRPLTLTGWQAIKLYMEMKDPDLRRGLEEGNEYSFGPGDTVQARVEKHIGPEGIAVGDALLQHFRDFYHEEANPYWRKTRGVDLPFNEFYSTAKRRVAKDSEMSPFDFIKKSAVPVSTITRKKNAHPLEPENALLAATNHLNDFTHFMANEDWDKQMGAVFNDPYVREIVKSKYGEGVWKDIKLLWDFHSGRLYIPNTVNMLDRMLSRASINFVAGRAVSFPRHLAATGAYLTKVNPVELASSTAHALFHPKEVVDTLHQSPLIKSKSSTLEREFLDIAHSEGGILFKDTGSFLSWASMLPVSLSSSFEKHLGAWAVYQKTLKATGSKAEALVAAEDATQELSFGGGPDTRSPFQLLHPVLAKFGTIEIKHASVVRLALRNVLSNTSPQTIVHAIGVLSTIGVALPAFDTAVKGAFGQNQNQDEMASNILTHITGLSVPVVDPLIKEATFALANVTLGHKNDLRAPTTVPESIAEDFTLTLKRLVETGMDPSYENILRLIHTGSSMNLLFPGPLGEFPLHTTERGFEQLFGIDTSKKTKDNDFGGEDFSKPIKPGKSQTEVNSSGLPSKF